MSSIQMMLNSGVSLETIAKNLGKTIDELKRILG